MGGNVYNCWAQDSVPVGRLGYCTSLHLLRMPIPPAVMPVASVAGGGRPQEARLKREKKKKQRLQALVALATSIDADQVQARAKDVCD